MRASKHSWIANEAKLFTLHTHILKLIAQTFQETATTNYYWLNETQTAANRIRILSRCTLCSEREETFINFYY